MQHGFVKNRSTSPNLILANEFITSSMEEGIQVDVIYTVIYTLLETGIHGDLYV